MLDPKQIISWLDEKVNGMRRSRLKTLSALVSAALLRCGIGVLSLGRSMKAQTSAKHCIKRVWRFLRNPSVEIPAVHQALFIEAARSGGSLVVLVDWTDLHPYRILVMAVARDGRALPFWSKTIRKSSGKGQMVRAEKLAIDFLTTVSCSVGHVTVVSDRGFGNSRWISSLQENSFLFVQRLSKAMTVCNSEYYCKLSELPVIQGQASKSFGRCTFGEGNPLSATLVAVWARDSAEPWYLAVNKEDIPEAAVDMYRKRMWIEAMFRDLKSTKWGMGLDEVRLSEPVRHDRHLLIIFLAYDLLVAYGAVAEKRGLAERLKANTVKARVLSLASIGFLTIKMVRCSINSAFMQLRLAPT
jgi:hypothetical protein